MLDFVLKVFAYAAFALGAAIIAESMWLAGKLIFNAVKRWLRP